MIGQIISHYQITAKLGAGGMGEVYLAEDTNLKRQVALKFLSERFTCEPEALSRFQREAEAIAALNHPGIVSVHDVSEHRCQPFIVMEYVAGQTLRALLEAGPVPIDSVLDLASQIAEALSAAHEQDIVHHDIKPENIHVTPKGRVKIVDFGLATWCGEGPVTEDGVAIGTIGYMSPEQATGDHPDRRSDIWSLGTVLYELLGGQRPFHGDYDHAIIYSILNEDPPSLGALRPDVPKALEKAIGKLMRKDPRDRYQTTEEFLEDLESIRRGTDLEHGASAVAPSIAVLPFANLSADPENEFFSDGLAEELISALTKVCGLRVVARTSAFAFKGKDVDVREIGRKLNVGSVLEGSVRRSGKRIRVTAQLVKADDGYHLWSDRYDREMADVFDIQDDITAAIVENLRVTLLGEDRVALQRRQTENVDALTLQLKGRYFWNKRTEEGMCTSIEYFRQAISADPSYVMAHVGLADAYQTLGYFGILPPRVVFPKCRDAAQAALALDDHSAAAHTSLGCVLYYFDWKWPEAEAELRRAIALEPGYSYAHVSYMEFLMAKGRFEEASSEATRALELDPLSLVTHAAWGFFQWLMGDSTTSIDYLRNTLEMDPTFLIAREALGCVYSFEGRYDEAVEILEAAVAQHESPRAISRLASAHAINGNHEEARRLLAGLEAMSEERYVSPIELAVVHATLGDVDEAFAHLDRAREDRTPQLVQLKVERRLANLRSDPRFDRLLEAVGLAE